MAFTLMKNIKKKIDYNKPDAKARRKPINSYPLHGIKTKKAFDALSLKGVFARQRDENLFLTFSASLRLCARICFYGIFKDPDLVLWIIVLKGLMITKS